MSVIADLRTVLVHRDFRKLFSVRLVSQCGDGLFQAGLATLFFFSPENLATAGAVAAAFAVLLLPFTIVGPFAGPLLDRWRRRQVLAVGNAIRVVLAIALAVIMATQGVGPAVYILALLTLGVNRFLLAALSAGLPRVVPREQLLIANTLTPTLGAVSAVVGAGLGFGLGWLVPAGPGKDGLVLATAAVLFGCAALLALRMAPDLLGPARAARTRTGFAAFSADVRATLRDLVDGAGYLIRRRTPGMALAVMALHRFLYGLNFIALILISRNLLSDPTDAAAGLAMFAVLTSISFAGNGLAIVATPIAHERMSPSTWIVVCLGLGAASQVLMAAAPEFAVIAAAAVLMGLAVQGAKIAVDTIVQRDTHDSFRGRAFSLYDMLYNAAFAGAAALAAAALPDTGWSRPVFAALAVAYVVIAVAYRRGVRRVHDRPVPVLDGERTPV
ncbi:MFS transporter [Occultella kanbiaonis]|uniref:MFS transporter n=1 Tax=Occultella kanbiaonis TaxID=2675754 RepID=UPI0013D61CEA|nr:MFS transporter [Occultella kanbiaonis]